ncbi:MAG TPA: PilT/PilU family type 4a pilus ATPase [Kofleriaceae bacterium]
MSAKLEQLLGYLDRKEVTEIIVGIGRPIALKMNGGYTPLTSLPVTEAQFGTLVNGTPLERVTKAGSAQPVEYDIGRRRVRVELIKRSGEESALRIQTAEPAKVAAAGNVAAVDEDEGLTLAPPAAPAPAAAPVALPTTKFATTIAMPKIAMPKQEPPATVAMPAAAPAMPSIDLGSVAASIAMPAEAQPVADEIEPADVEAAPRGDDAIFDEKIDVSGIAAYVRAARKLAASDLHIVAGRPVQVRVMGELRPIDAAAAAVPSDIVDRILLPLLGPRRRLQLRTSGYVDLAFDVQNAGRLRGNISRQQGGLRAAFRLARVLPPTLEELNLPRELAKVVTHHQGLVVIAGPNGQGKTTTMAALVDLVNSTKAYHIITIEDPVELEHPRKQAVITQREVGRHTKSFAAALKASLREDPDVIVIGELRDRETVEIALTAAETGHLVLATMSTPSAAKTIDRLIDMFPPADQAQARASIAGALRAVVAQRLLPAASGDGVVPAVEMVTGVLPLAVLIRDDKLYQLPNLMQRGRAFGMIRFEDSLLELLRSGRISEDTARQYTPGAAAAQAKQQVTQAMGRVGRRE